MKLHVLPLMIAVALTSACAQAASPPPPAAPAPAANPEATRAEIDRLVARIQELAKQLGGNAHIRIEKHEFDGPGMPPRDDRREVIIERHRDGEAPMAAPMFPGGMMAPNSAGIGVVLAPNQAASGVRIAAVTPDSPAMKGGLRTGDVLLSVDGKKISGSGAEGVDSARHLLGGLKKDQVVRLGYARAGKTGEATVKADHIRRMMMFNRDESGDLPGMPGMPGDEDGDRHLRVFAPEIDAEIARGLPMRHCPPGSRDCAMPAMFEAFRWQGLNLASVDVQLGRYFGTDHGVLVLSSGDDLKGLQSGDVIEHVAGAEVKTPRDVMRSLREKSAGSRLNLDLLRDRKLLALTITVPEEKA
ncbi:MAG TPA: PDZ domain-containing protein, partial [Luteimonas sp.]|nr:PDZ domain-containing protein [Luteimonas sp.]